MSVIKYLRTIVICLITTSLLLISIGCTSSKLPSLTVLTAASGDISVSKADTDSSTAGKVGMQLGIGDTLKAGAASYATITFFEGSTIKLKENTQVVITSLDQASSGTTTILLKQIIGETTSQVIKLVDLKSRYEIDTVSAAAAIRGSEMLVSVTSSGVTTVGNIEGKVSIIAQGVEIPIPQGNHCTASPGQPPSQPEPGTTAVTIATPVYTDTIHDLFDANGKPTLGEDYLDIVKSQLSLTGGIYTLHLELNGPCPLATTEPSNTIEWDLLIDTDSNATTGTRFPLISNDVGYDYLVRMILQNTQYRAEILNTKTNTSLGIDFLVAIYNYKEVGNIVELYFPSANIGNPTSLYWIVAIRKYLVSDLPSQPSVSDKSPNEGHSTFP